MSDDGSSRDSTGTTTSSTAKATSSALRTTRDSSFSFRSTPVVKRRANESPVWEYMKKSSTEVSCKVEHCSAKYAPDAGQ